MPNSGWADVVEDYGADPNGSAECSASFRNAQASGLPIYVPPGTYNFDGAGLNDTSMRVIGSGSYQTAINLGAGRRFVDASGPFYNVLFKGLRVNGGAGFCRNTYTGSNVNEFKVFEDIRFYNYTNACIECNSSDSPYWIIHRCLFYGANFTSSVGVALSGFTDSNSIRNCSFMQNRVAIKMKTGVCAKIADCDFLRFGPSAGYPRVDVWLVPSTTSDPNAGQGFVLSDSKFGNEYLEGTDFRVLIADEGAGTYFGDRFPVYTASTGMLHSQTYSRINNSGGTGSENMALVTSYTPNIRGFCIGPVNQSGIDFQPLLRLNNASGFDPSTNIVGPLHGEGIDQASPGDLVVATAGSLTGQPRIM